jgi:hypothetical protein
MIINETYEEFKRMYFIAHPIATLEDFARAIYAALVDHARALEQAQSDLDDGLDDSVIGDLP